MHFIFIFFFPERSAPDLMGLKSGESGACILVVSSGSLLALVSTNPSTSSDPGKCHPCWWAMFSCGTWDVRVMGEGLWLELFQILRTFFLVRLSSLTSSSKHIIIMKWGLDCSVTWISLDRGHELAPAWMRTDVGIPCPSRRGGSKLRGDCSSHGPFNPRGGGCGKEGSLPARVTHGCKGFGKRIFVF